MGALIWLLAALLVLAVVALASLLYQVLRQQGRLLLRLEALEEALAVEPPTASSNGAAARPEGIPAATPFPPFRLPDLSGREVSLEDFRGKRVLLVHWDPRCSWCSRIASELAALQQDLARRNTQLVLVSHRGNQANQAFAAEHGFECPILLQEESNPVQVFAPLGTPVAYLLDEKGRVAKPLALGAEEVPALAREAAGAKKRLTSERSLSESKLEREGLKPGTPAPAFALPDLEGRTVALEEYRGRRVLLVFSDPECGPCDALAPELARLDDEARDDLEIVMVTRGGVEENRRKTEEHGIRFPVVLQPRWKVSKDYGIFATPVAFLVDEEGVIPETVAKGGPEILRLARSALRAGKEVRSV